VQFRLFPAQITLVLDPLGCAEKVGIDRRSADRAAHLPHRFLHCVKKGATGILHGISTVRDLGGVRGRALTVASA
jgi:hypothetical protein